MARESGKTDWEEPGNTMTCWKPVTFRGRTMTWSVTPLYTIPTIVCVLVVRDDDYAYNIHAVAHATTQTKTKRKKYTKKKTRRKKDSCIKNHTHTHTMGALLGRRFDIFIKM